MNEATHRIAVIEATIKDSIKTEHLVRKCCYGSPDLIVTPSENLRMTLHMELKYVEHDMRDGCHDTLNAVSPEGERYADIVPCWDHYTEKDRDQYITDDYGALSDEIKKRFEAAIADAETVEDVSGTHASDYVAENFSPLFSPYSLTSPKTSGKVQDGEQP